MFLLLINAIARLPKSTKFSSSNSNSSSGEKRVSTPNRHTDYVFPPGSQQEGKEAKDDAPLSGFEKLRRAAERKVLAKKKIFANKKQPRSDLTLYPGVSKISSDENGRACDTDDSNPDLQDNLFPPAQLISMNSIRNKTDRT